MTLTRVATPAQFRSVFLAAGVQQVSPTPNSTTSGAFTKTSGISFPGGQVGDIVFAQLASPSAGVVVEGQITAANTLELVWYNISGSTYNPGAAVAVNVITLRPKLA